MRNGRGLTLSGVRRVFRGGREPLRLAIVVLPRFHVIRRRAAGNRRGLSITSTHLFTADDFVNLYGFVTSL
jgi:hypothetical protein